MSDLILILFFMLFVISCVVSTFIYKEVSPEEIIQNLEDKKKDKTFYEKHKSTIESLINKLKDKCK